MLHHPIIVTLTPDTIPIPNRVPGIETFLKGAPERLWFQDPLHNARTPLNGCLQL